MRFSLQGFMQITFYQNVAAEIQNSIFLASPSLSGEGRWLNAVGPIDWQE